MDSKFLLNGVEFLCKHGDETRVELCARRDGETDIYTFKCDFGKARRPEKIKLLWKADAKDVYCRWNVAKKDRHISYGKGDGFQSRLASWAPILQAVSASGKNCFSVAIKDVKTPIFCNMNIDIYKEDIETELTFFDDMIDPIASYETEIRIDSRTLPFDRVLSDIKAWYASFSKTKSTVPEKAFVPMYSTWYSYLQNISSESLINECREAKKYGMDAVILDDGWQTDNPSVMYGYTGDWQPTKKKFPDMRATVDSLHELGMGVIVWFSVPFVGYFSKNHSRFEGKYLRNLDTLNASVLDPRYSEVRDFLIETYVNAVKDWDLDGVKLDFIDRFFSNGEVSDGMDISSVEDATERLLLDISAALKAVKSDILIEFRQPYMGPVVTECGNMMRVWDCPLDPLYNRIDTLSLRLAVKNCAVHADMINWAANDSPENVAVRLFSTVFAVPQISVRMNEITEEQKKALKNYLDCYNSNRHVIMDGEFSATDPASNYSSATAVLDGELFAVGYCKNVFDTNACKRAVLVNLTSEDEIVVKNAKDSAYTVYNCMGEAIERGRVSADVEIIPVPTAARAEILKFTQGA